MRGMLGFPYALDTPFETVNGMSTVGPWGAVKEYGQENLYVLALRATDWEPIPHRKGVFYAYKGVPVAQYRITGKDDEGFTPLLMAGTDEMALLTGFPTKGDEGRDMLYSDCGDCGRCLLDSEIDNEGRCPDCARQAKAVQDAMLAYQKKCSRCGFLAGDSGLCGQCQSYADARGESEYDYEHPDMCQCRDCQEQAYLKDKHSRGRVEDQISSFPPVSDDDMDDPFSD
jgi:hypothetical protein